MFLISSCSRLCQIHWCQALSWESRCSWSSADRRCSNYIWVINNIIAYLDVTYIRDLMVSCLKINGDPAKGAQKILLYLAWTSINKNTECYLMGCTHVPTHQIDVYFIKVISLKSLSELSSLQSKKVSYFTNHAPRMFCRELLFINTSVYIHTPMYISIYLMISLPLFILYNK